MRTRQAVRFLLVGAGDRLTWARTRFQQAGLADRVIAPGILEGAAAADAYAAMDLFAFASLSDTQGLVLAEAMAAGRPVIALDGPGARDCVEGSVGMLLPASTSAKEFADASLALLDDESRRRACGVQARSVAQRFSRASCLQALTAAYDHVIDRYADEPSREAARGRNDYDLACDASPAGISDA